MTKTIFEVAGAIIISFGGATVVLYALSNWLGKLWANRLIESYKRELDLKYEIQNRSRKLFEEFSESIENMFATKDDELSLNLNKLFGLLALYAPDEVYRSLKKSLEGRVQPQDAKPLIYHELRKYLYPKTKLTIDDLAKHIIAKPVNTGTPTNTSS